MENYVGTRLDLRYEIREMLGIGGMAVVYKAYDTIDDRIVAVKILKSEYLGDNNFLDRFKNESRAIATLNHKNIVKVYDVSFGAKLQYIVEEYIDGITLKEYINQEKVLSAKEAVYYTEQILMALQHAHDKGIVHRDVKPQNIMLISDGTIKITDFGIAKFSRNDTGTLTENAIGTVHYMSPEQARGEDADARSDLYSVGVVLYEMLTGILPFDSDSLVGVAIKQLSEEAERPSKLNPQVPLGLEQITLRAMRKKPMERYQTCAEMINDIDEFRRNPSIKFDYNTFVDDSPTRYIEGGRKEISEELPIKRVPQVRQVVPLSNEQPEEPQVNTKTMPIILGIISALAILMIIFTSFIYVKNYRNIKVPDFIGKNYEKDIKGNSKYKDFNIEKLDVYSTDKEPGEILSQTPEKDTKIKVKDKITLQVSYNDTSVLLKGILGLAEADAKAKLQAMGVSVTVSKNYRKDLDDGIVYDITPSEGSYVQKGSTVTIYVSTSKNTQTVKVPSVRGLLETDAKSYLENSGFKVSVVIANSEKPKGTVIEQDPREDRDAATGSTVTLTISSGPKETTTENTTAKTTASQTTKKEDKTEVSSTKKSKEKSSEKETVKSE